MVWWCMVLYCLCVCVCVLSCIMYELSCIVYVHILYCSLCGIRYTTWIISCNLTYNISYSMIYYDILYAWWIQKMWRIFRKPFFAWSGYLGISQIKCGIYLERNCNAGGVLTRHPDGLQNYPSKQRQVFNHSMFSCCLYVKQTIPGLWVQVWTIPRGPRQPQ